MSKFSEKSKKEIKKLKEEKIRLENMPLESKDWKKIKLLKTKTRSLTNITYSRTCSSWRSLLKTTTPTRITVLLRRCMTYPTFAIYSLTLQSNTAGLPMTITIYQKQKKQSSNNRAWPRMAFTTELNITNVLQNCS